MNAGDSDKATKESTPGEQAYHAAYYVANRQTLSQRRRQRYLTDPQYREKVKRSAMARYQKNSEERKVERERVMSEVADLEAQISKLVKEAKGATPAKSEKLNTEIAELEMKLEDKGSTLQTGVRGYNRPRVKLVGDKDVLVHCVSEFADRVGRDVQTITAWEANDIIPPPTVTDEMGRRWYSDPHIEFIAEVADDFKRSGGRNLAEFKELVSKKWKKANG
jgi:DNA-binding transcriptional MerR regulator